MLFLPLAICVLPLGAYANRYWDSVRVKNNRSDLFLVKLGTEGIVPEAEFASSNGTKRVSFHTDHELNHPGATVAVVIFCARAAPYHARGGVCQLPRSQVGKDSHVTQIKIQIF